MESHWWRYMSYIWRANYIFQASYQKQATVLWRITRNCSGTYWWFTHPTTGQNCTYNSRSDINYMPTPLCYRITPKFNVTYCPRCILDSWIFLLDFRFHMDPGSPCANYRIEVNSSWPVFHKLVMAGLG